MPRIRIAIAIVVLISLNPSVTHSLSHQWSVGYGLTQEQVPTSVAVDASGNILLAVDADLGIDLGGGFLPGNRFFYGMFDANGNHLWSAGNGGSFDLATDVAFDPAGNVIMTGTFQAPVDFGGGAISSNGLKDIYLAKLDPGGNHVWSMGFGDGVSQEGAAVAVDFEGNIVIAATFEGSVDFGGGPLTSAGANDVCLARFDAAGNHVWSRSFGGVVFDFSQDVAIDGSGNILFAGEHGDGIDFGGGPLAVSGGGDAFLAAFDSSGTYLWGHSFGGPSGGAERGLAVAVDAGGNVALAGTFDDDIDLGGGVLATSDAVDIFLARFDAAGTHLWSQGFGGPSNETIRGGGSVATGAEGEIILTGSFMQSIDFGGGPLTSTTYSDVFIARLDSAGGHLWSGQFGGDGHQLSEALAVTAAGEVVVTGRFVNDIDLGGGALISAGGNDVFLARYGEVTTGATPTPLNNFTLEVYPNPFNPATSIVLWLEHAARTRVTVYDVRGRPVRTLGDRYLDAGRHAIQWDGRSDSGGPVSSGVYFVRARLDGRTVARKVVLTK